MYHALAAGQVQPAAIAIRMREAYPRLSLNGCGRWRQRMISPPSTRYARSGRGHWQRAMDQPHDGGGVRGHHGERPDAFVRGYLRSHVFGVSQRRKEVGIGMALGADWKQSSRAFSRELLQLAAGAALGAALGITLEKASGTSSCGATRRLWCLLCQSLSWWSDSWPRSVPPAAASGSSRVKR